MQYNFARYCTYLHLAFVVFLSIAIFNLVARTSIELSMFKALGFPFKRPV